MHAIVVALPGLLLVAALAWAARTLYLLPDTLRKFGMVAAYVSRRRRRRRLTNGLEALDQALACDEPLVSDAPRLRAVAATALADLSAAQCADAVSTAAIVTAPRTLRRRS